MLLYSVHIYLPPLSSAPPLSRFCDFLVISCWTSSLLVTLLNHVHGSQGLFVPRPLGYSSPTLLVMVQLVIVTTSPEIKLNTTVCVSVGRGASQRSSALGLVKVDQLLCCGWPSPTPPKAQTEDQEEGTGSHSLTPGAGSWICSAVTDSSHWLSGSPLSDLWTTPPSVQFSRACNHVSLFLITNPFRQIHRWWMKRWLTDT